MSELEFQTSVNESIDMVKNGQRLPRVESHFLSEQEWNHYQDLMSRDAMQKKAAPVVAAKDAIDEAYKVKLGLAHALVPLLICASWILGAMEGLADPVFTAVITAVCVLWAWVNYKWGAVNA